MPEPHSKLKPKRITDSLSNMTPIFAELIFKEHYKNETLHAQGIIFDISLMGDYVTFSIHDADNVYICANFLKPLKLSLSTLKTGDHISLYGKIFNATEDIIVLDNCWLEGEQEPNKPIKMHLPDFPSKLKPQKKKRGMYLNKIGIWATILLGLLVFLFGDNIYDRYIKWYIIELYNKISKIFI